MTTKQSEQGKIVTELINEGLSSYLDALRAIVQFKKHIINKSKLVLEKRMDDLSKAMGIKFERKNVVPYTNDDDSCTWGWVTAKYVTEVIECYFGLSFERNDKGSAIPYATVMMSTYNALNRDYIMEEAEKYRISVENEDNEISIYEEMQRHKSEDFEQILDALISKWVDLWTKIGGVAKLPKK